METPRLIAELARHHDAVLAHLNVTRRLLALPAQTAQPQLARRRWELIRILRAYQLFKHGELFDPLIRRGGPAAPLARAMKDRCSSLGDAVAAHIRLWSTTGATVAWGDYVAAETAMVDRLLGHLRRESEEARRLVPAATMRAA